MLSLGLIGRTEFTISYNLDLVCLFMFIFQISFSLKIILRYYSIESFLLFRCISWLFIFTLIRGLLRVN